MLLNNHAPILIPVRKREEYFEARNREDVNWIKNFFEEESKKELKALNKLIDAYELEKKSQPSKKLK